MAEALKRKEAESLHKRAAWWRLTFDGGNTYRTGGDDSGNQVLPRYESETTEAHARRVAATPVLNIASEFARQRRDAVMATEQQRAFEGDKILEAFEQDCDGNGTSLEDWMGGRLLDGLISRYVWLGVDAPRKADGDVEAPTLADVMQGPSRPYLVHADPTSVWDWRIRHGVVEYIAIRYVESIKGDLFGKERERVTFMTWTELEWIEYEEDEDGEDLHEIARGRNAFGFVPWHRWEPLPGESYVGRFADLQLSITQTRSDMVAEQKANSYTLKVLWGVNKSELEPAPVGPTNALCFTNPAGRIDTVQGSPEVMRELRENLVMDIGQAYRRSEMSNAKAQASPQSGVAHAYQFRELEALLGGLARSTQGAENAVVAMFARTIKRDPEKVAKTSYDDTFDVADEAARSAELWKMLESKATPPTVRREAWRSRVTAVWPMDSERREEMLEEIDEQAKTAAEAPETPPAPGDRLRSVRRAVLPFGQRQAEGA